jgi:hypothetical protein
LYHTHIFYRQTAFAMTICGLNARFSPLPAAPVVCRLFAGCVPLMRRLCADYVIARTVALCAVVNTVRYTTGG